MRACATVNPSPNNGYAVTRQICTVRCAVLTRVIVGVIFLEDTVNAD
jgi:hypothetical protein